MKQVAFPAPSLSFFAALREGIVITTPEVSGATIVWVSPSFTRITGYEPAEVLGRSPQLMQGPLTDPTVIEQLRDALRAGTGWEGQTWNYRRDGTPFLMQWSVEPLLDAAGVRTHWMAVQRDVTHVLSPDRPRSERLGLSFGNNSCATLLIDKKLQIAAMNSEAARILGAGRVGEPFLATSLAPPGVSERDEVRVALLMERSHTVQFSLDDPQLGPRVFELQCSAVSWPSTNLRATITIADVTDRRRTEQIAAGVSLSDNIGHAFAGIRHELGNPVNSLKSAVSLLRSEITSMAPEQVAAYLEAMEKECLRMDFLLRSLRNFSSLDTVECKSANVADIMSSFERVVAGPARARNVQLEIALSPDCEEVWVDERALFQVLLNLVTNAFEACDGVETACVSITVAPDPGGVRFEIRDNGAGIPMANRDKLSRPFFTTKRGGTGLGLAMSQRLVSRMSGSLSMQSELGLGSTFAVVLPRRAPARPPSVRPGLGGYLP